MFQELLPLFPKEAGVAALVATLLGALSGLVLWIAGARYSRMLVTLLAVSIGGVVGIMAPRWFKWDINTMASGVGGAMVLGLSGFALHRIWVGLGLGLTLACWAALATWFVFRNGASLTWPDGSMVGGEFWTKLWSDLPDNVRRVAPFTTVAAAFIGMMGAILWPRIAAALLYSVLGVTVMLFASLWAIQCGRFEWPRFVPAAADTQAVILLGMVVLGMLVQSQIVPVPKAPVKEAAAK